MEYQNSTTNSGIEGYRRYTMCKEHRKGLFNSGTPGASVDQAFSPPKAFTLVVPRPMNKLQPK